MVIATNANATIFEVQLVNDNCLILQGSRGSGAAEGDHGAAEDEAGLGRQRVGRHQEVHLRSVLPPGR